MDTKKSVTQSDVNDVWSAVWRKETNTKARQLFVNRSFIESYPIIRKYIPEHTRSILEIGSGSGRYGIKLAQDFPHGHIVATDMLQESVDLITQLKHDLQLENMTVEKADLFKLQYDDNFFDVILCDVVIQHLPNYRDSLSEMYRVLKPGGRLLITTNNTLNLPHTFLKLIRGKKYEYGFEKSFTRGELRDLLEENKFSVDSIDGYYAAYGIYRLKKYWKGFKLLGKIINRGVKIIDRFTNRIVSKTFGFVLLGVGIKESHE